MNKTNAESGLRDGATPGQSNVVVVDFSNRPLPDLRDMDNVHRNVESGRLADIFTQIADAQRDPDR